MDDTQHFSRALGLLGVDLPEPRRAAVAQQLERQLSAERLATAKIQFEMEPAVFTRVLEAGAK